MSNAVEDPTVTTCSTAIAAMSELRETTARELGTGASSLDLDAISEPRLEKLAHIFYVAANFTDWQLDELIHSARLIDAACDQSGRFTEGDQVIAAHRANGLLARRRLVQVFRALGLDPDD
jgi:hypothetical protein